MPPGPHFLHSRRRRRREKSGAESEFDHHAVGILQENLVKVEARNVGLVELHFLFLEVLLHRFQVGGMEGDVVNGPSTIAV